MKTIKNISMQALCLFLKDGGNKVVRQVVYPNDVIAVDDVAITKQVEDYALKRMIKIS
jgi:hypothetical protein